jgi:hypothetical protein
MGGCAERQQKKGAKQKKEQKKGARRAEKMCQSRKKVSV